MMRSLHLDLRIRLESPEDSRLDEILDADKIPHHAFLPFIEFTKITRRYRKLEDGSRQSEDKSRKLCYASHKDSLVYSWYARLLGSLYEAHLTKKPFASSVIAYRHIPRLDSPRGGRSNIHFAKEVFNSILEIGECTVLTFDVKDFFPTIDHLQLKEMWCSIIDEDQLPEDHYNVFYSLTHFSIVKMDALLVHFGAGVGKQKKQFPDERKGRICSAQELRDFRKLTFEGHKSVEQHHEDCGIPQGSSMSGLLSNIFMLDFDEAVYAEVTRLGGKYWRYSDDIAIVLPTGADIKTLDEFVRVEGKNKKLNLHGVEKSATIKFSQTPKGVRSTEEALDYLGFRFDGEKILLRDKTIARFFRRMSNAVRAEVSRANKYDGRINVRKLQRDFTHQGTRSKERRNFLTYAKNASVTTESVEIKEQVSHAASILQKKIAKRRARYKRWSGSQ